MTLSEHPIFCHSMILRVFYVLMSPAIYKDKQFKKKISKMNITTQNFEDQPLISKLFLFIQRIINKIITYILFR